MVRLGVPADLPVIDTFDQFGDSRAGEVAAGKLHVFEADGRAVAYLTDAGDALLGHPFVSYLCVAEPYRRRGIGAALLGSAERRRAGSRLVISTEETNGPMRALLAGRGYTEAGTLRGLNAGDVGEVFYYKDC